MTPQEAIPILERLQEPEPWEPQISRDAYEALELAIEALKDRDKQSASSEQADHIADSDKMVDQFRGITKKTDDVSISKQEVLTNIRKLCDGCYLMEHCGQCNPNCLLRKAMDVVEKIKTDSERVSPSEQEKSNSFSKEPSESIDSEMNSTKFKPGDKFILELGQERKMFGEFEIKGTDLYVKTDLLEKLTRYEPEA